MEYVLERAAGGGTRKVTSHGLHGLHPYKGKFYPQLARALLNVCDVPEGGIIVDPFAGCGTSVLEASLLGIQAIGVDANPMGVLVSQAKLQLLGTPVQEVQRQFAPLQRLPDEAVPLPDEDYLSRWFPPGNLAFLRRAVAGIGQLKSEVARNGAMVALSSVLREASWQDPHQLRVRRRSGEQIPNLGELFYEALEQVIEELTAIQAIREVTWQNIPMLGSKVVFGDARELSKYRAP